MSLLLLLLAACRGPAEPADRCGAAAGGPQGSQIALDLGPCGGIALDARILGEGDFTLRLEEDGGVLTPIVEGEGVFEALVLEGEYDLDGGGPLRLWRQGYQSWSWSGVTEVEAVTLDDDGLPEVGGDGDATSVVLERPGTSWWVGLVGRAPGRSLLLGALSATRTRFWVAFDETRAWAVWDARGAPVAVEGLLALDPFVIAMGGDPVGLFEEYAGRAAPGPPRGRPPTGWATWYQLWSAVTEDDVRANLEVAAALGSRADLAPLEVFQVDDGWQVRWGDWTAGDDFPSGMAAVAEEIAAAGLVPGLWMAPFYVSRESEVWAAHSDWWVRDAEGEELAFTNLGSGDYAVIDATHPEAGAWMAEQVADRVAEGWTWLKLDFLYAGAQEGQRHAAVTGVEAYRQGLELLREAAGDAWVLACGAPFLPTLGFADQYRTGADIAFEIDPDPRLDYLRWQARSTAARAWTNGRWWWVDADQVLVREPFTGDEARGAVVANAVSGGAWFLGDDLTALPDDRLSLALLPEAVAFRGGAARPAAPLDWPSGLDAGPTAERIAPDDRVPTRWTWDDGSVALLNLSAEEVAVEGPGGVELLTGVRAGAGERALAPGAGEIWRKEP